MAIYTMLPVIEIRVLEDELLTQFGIACGDLTPILFGDNYMNDCYKLYSFDQDEEYKYSWENEEHIHIRNLINTYLRDTIPNHTHVLIDITW